MSWRRPKLKRLNRILDLVKQLRDLEVEETKKKMERLKLVLDAKKSRSGTT